MKLSYLSALAFSASALGQSVQLHPNGNRAKCLDVRRNVAPGAPVQMYVLFHSLSSQQYNPDKRLTTSYDCNGSPTENWNFQSGSTLIRLANSPFCIDV